MEKPNYPISIEEVVLKFKEHIDNADNRNIIFSGKFGIGKTFFLQNFFQHYDKKTNVVYVSPVNYVVSSNESIFDLIKADIIKELYMNGSLQVVGEIEFSELDYLSQYLINNPEKFIEYLLPLFSKLSVEGEIANIGLEAFKKFKEEFSSYKKKLKDTGKQEAEVLLEFAESILTKNHYYLEENAITSLIKDILNKLKEKGSENILVIDDLDRLDPEHIFRILNILCVHKDERYDKNKFDFDKIIIVCDIENIEKIFHYKYGPDVDFNGYIDKFYSVDIFHFSNREAIINYVEQNIGGELSEAGKSLLSELLILFVNNGKINLRQLFKHKYFERTPSPKFKMFEMSLSDIGLDERFAWAIPSHVQDSNLYIDSTDLELFRIIRFLSIQFGDINNLKKTIQSTQIIENKSTININTRDEGLFLHEMIKAKHALFTGVPEKFFKGKTDINYPEGSFYSTPYRIVLKWAAHTRYDGKAGFYKDAKVHLVRRSGSAYQDRQFTVEWREILNDILLIINTVPDTTFR